MIMLEQNQETEGTVMEEQQHKPRDWSKLTPAEKKKNLFLKQKETLDLFLERHAISKEQYDKSLGDLRIKMGIADDLSK